MYIGQSYLYTNLNDFCQLLKKGIGLTVNGIYATTKTPTQGADR